jgi:hypothetical protein
MTKNLFKKLKKFAKKNTALLVVASLLLVLGTSVIASGSLYDDVVDRIADKWLGGQTLEGVKEMALGTITMDKTRFQHGIAITGEGLDITGGDVDIDVDADFSGDASFSNPDATYQFDLNFQQSTTTSGVATQATQLLVGTQKISGDMLCYMAAADLTATGIFGYDFRLGTSTSATSSDAHLIADTAVATSTNDILNKEDDEGTTTDFVWSVSDGEYFAAMITFDTANATSAASFTEAGGNAGAGKVHVNCFNED